MTQPLPARITIADRVIDAHVSLRDQGAGRGCTGTVHWPPDYQGRHTMEPVRVEFADGEQRDATVDGDIILLPGSLPHAHPDR